MSLTRRVLLLSAAGWPWATDGVESSDMEDALRKDDDFVAGMKSLRGGEFAPALVSFQRALRRHPDSADLHTELGFAHRRLRQFDKAFEHYRRALTIDPRHRGAHEYIGEAYLDVGDLAGAQRHLAALREICLLPCEEVNELLAAIAAYRARTGVR